MSGLQVRVDIEDVRAELHTDDVIRFYSLKVKRRGSQYRMPECFCCHETSSSEAIAIDIKTGLWCHHGHEREAGGECSGDLLDLIAACEGWDRRRDFPKVIERAAKIAGVEARPLTEAERAQRRAFREQQAAERERQADLDHEKMLREAMIRASSEWKRLRHHSPAGRAYLVKRGLRDRRLVDDDYVRFAANGDICVGLYDLVHGELVNVVRRVIAAQKPADKVRVLSNCPQRGTLCGRLQEIHKGRTVITEGVFDTLTAIMLWPDATVLGASGAGQLARVTAAAAPHVRDAGGRLGLVPDLDDVGQRAALRAGEAALEAGLVMDRTLVVFDVEPHHDLNEAYGKGWRP